MKLWIGYGSEHSYSLVMVGRFTDETKARTAEERFRRLATAAEAELSEQGWDPIDSRFSEEMREVLKELNLWDLSRLDVENFGYEHGVEVEGNELRISTDEGEVQGFLKVLIDGGARVEVYSSHFWTDEGRPRSEENEAQASRAGDD